MFNNYKNNYKKISFGNTEYIANYLKAAQKIDTSQIGEAMTRISQNINETFSDQVFQNIISINKNSDNLSKYFSQITTDKKKVSGFELFTKTWIVFEKVIAQINTENGKANRKNFVPNLVLLKEVSHLKQRELQQIRKLRTIRNQMLHGYASFPDGKLEASYLQLKHIVEKYILIIKNEELKKKLTDELK